MTTPTRRLTGLVNQMPVGTSLNRRSPVWWTVTYWSKHDLCWKETKSYETPQTALRDALADAADYPGEPDK